MNSKGDPDVIRGLYSLERPDVGGDPGEAVDAVDHAELFDRLGT